MIVMEMRMKMLVADISQRCTTVLATEAFFMIALVGDDKPLHIVRALRRYDCFVAQVTLWSINSDVVADAMRSRVNVDSERLLVQWQTTLVTSETVDMVRVAHRTQHAISDDVTTDEANVRVELEADTSAVILAIELLINAVELSAL